MSFDCRYYSDHKCMLQNGMCKPAIGKCILKGKVSRAKDELEDLENNTNDE